MTKFSPKATLGKIKEFFLNPWIIILTDRKGLNYDFIKKYLKRKWLYKYSKSCDQHISSSQKDMHGDHSEKLKNLA